MSILNHIKYKGISVEIRRIELNSMFLDWSDIPSIIYKGNGNDSYIRESDREIISGYNPPILNNEQIRNNINKIEMLISNYSIGAENSLIDIDIDNICNMVDDVNGCLFNCFKNGNASDEDLCIVYNMLDGVHAETVTTSDGEGCSEEIIVIITPAFRSEIKVSDHDAIKNADNMFSSWAFNLAFDYIIRGTSIIGYTYYGPNFEANEMTTNIESDIDDLLRVTDSDDDDRKLIFSMVYHDMMSKGLELKENCMNKYASEYDRNINWDVFNLALNNKSIKQNLEFHNCIPYTKSETQIKINIWRLERI